MEFLTAQTKTQHTAKLGHYSSLSFENSTSFHENMCSADEVQI